MHSLAGIPFVDQKACAFAERSKFLGDEYSIEILIEQSHLFNRIWLPSPKFHLKSHRAQHFTLVSSAIIGQNRFNLEINFVANEKRCQPCTNLNKPTSTMDVLTLILPTLFANIGYSKIPRLFSISAIQCSICRLQMALFGYQKKNKPLLSQYY